MAKFRASRFLQIVILLLVCVASAVVGFAIKRNAKQFVVVSQPVLLQQSDEKVIERKEYGYEPFEFSDLGVRRSKIVPRQKLSAAALAETGGGQVEDWLENLQFTIKNKWEKSISYIDFDLTFPETRAGRPMMAYDLDIGTHPSAAGDSRKYGQKLTLKPGEALTFTLSAKKLASLKNFLALGGFQLASLNKAVIRIDYIIFEDGMMWEQGSWYKPVKGEEPGPGKSGKYERVNE